MLARRASLEPLDKPLDRLMVLSEVEGLGTLSLSNGQSAIALRRNLCERSIARKGAYETSTGVLVQ